MARSLEIFDGSPDSTDSNPDYDDSETSDLTPPSERGRLTGESLHSGRTDDEGSLWGHSLDSFSSYSPVPASPDDGQGPKRKRPIRPFSPVDRYNSGSARRDGSLRDLLFSSSSHLSPTSPASSVGSGGGREKSPNVWTTRSCFEVRNKTNNKPRFRLPDLDEGMVEEDAGGREGSIRLDDVFRPEGRSYRDNDDIHGHFLNFEEETVEKDASGEEESIQLDDVFRPEGRRNVQDDDEGHGFANDDDDVSLGDFVAFSDGDRYNKAGSGDLNSMEQGWGEPHNEGGIELGASMSNIDTTGFFDALEDQYREALKGEKARMKKGSPSTVRFPAKDGNGRAGALAAVGVPASERLDLFDEILDSTQLDVSDGRLNDSDDIDYRNEGDYDDEDDVSIYEELFGDEVDPVEEEEEEEVKAQEKKMLRGILYGVGGMAILGGFSWAAQKVLTAMSRGEDDGGGGASPAMHADRGADVGHAAEVTADTIQLSELPTDGAVAAVVNNGAPAQGGGMSGGTGNASAGNAAAAQ